MKRALVFDSGVGGLSVVDAIAAAGLAVEIVYAADNAWLPYGEKAPEALRARIPALIAALAHTDWFEGPRGDESFSAEEARANRRILYWAMARAGFVNHPEEWWHYSWGDQAWAAQTGADAALYGLAAAPA